MQLTNREHDPVTDVRALADHAFSCAAGAPLIGGNSVRLLKDAREIGWEENGSIQDRGCYSRVTKGWN